MKEQNNVLKSKAYETSKNSVDVSIVIPCYNQEKYIETCLDCIEKQNNNGLEAIVVDDGSTDLTRAKVESFIQKTDKLKVTYIYQQNAGPGVARNTGLDHASGKYIAFFDSDDTVPQGAYDALFYTAEKYDTDVVIGTYMKRIDSGNWYVIDTIKQYCSENEGKNCAGDYIIAIKHPSLWNRLFNREFLNKNKIRFLPEFHGEDTVFNLDAVKYAKKIYTTESVVYYYIKRTAEKTSLSTSWSKRTAESVINTFSHKALAMDAVGDTLAEFVFIKTGILYILEGLGKMADLPEVQVEMFEKFKTLLKKYHNNPKYQPLIEVLLGVKIDEILPLDYKAYKFFIASVFYAKKSNAPAAAAAATMRYGDPKELALQDFKNGKIGIKYIMKYLKAWAKFKIKRNK